MIATVARACAPAGFPPTRQEALARIAAVRPAAYAQSRNALEGAVTRLSPYITHGIVGLPEVLAGVASRHRLEVQHKFVFELGWREYFRHVWTHRGECILRSLHPGPLPDEAYSPELPADIREARSGVPVVDQAVRTLYATGYLHNHARMWLASYAVHLRKVHWRAGADWMFAHLLDGDLASNHLSWQWVAGTASRKPYLFDAGNVARYAPASWHSPGSVVDVSYGTLDTLAHRAQGVSPAPRGEGVAEPRPGSVPPAANRPDPVQVAGRDVWLVHPWALGEVPRDLPPERLCLGWWPADWHTAWPWSPARWAFVATRMAQLAPAAWHCSALELGAALASARTVRTQADPHLAGLLPAGVQQREPWRLFPAVAQACPSFSAWWARATQGIRNVAELPGLAAWLAQAPPGPLFDNRPGDSDVLAVRRP